MKKKKNQEERKKLPLNRGVEILLRSQEKKKEPKVFNFKFERLLFGYIVKFEIFVHKQKILGEYKC